MLMLNWISSACIVQVGQAGPLYVNATISMDGTNYKWFFNQAFRLFSCKKLTVTDCWCNLLPIFNDTGNFKEQNPERVGKFLLWLLSWTKNILSKLRKRADPFYLTLDWKPSTDVADSTSDSNLKHSDDLKSLRLLNNFAWLVAFLAFLTFS